MTQEALKLALEFIERVNKDGWILADFEPQMYATITAIKEALAQPEQEPVGKLQEPTAERAWFTIAELNAWADKKLAENPHWVMPKDEPERDEPPPQRTWVGLTDEERSELVTLHHGWNEYGQAIEAKLKEKNT